ncbi:hypothetical protein LR48_Vigan118s002500 [Vigna angularis]|uniref:Uncharacterized protein n=1 Tax=Phaseolus angularis TaxID=3914 RepID=A0A0L9T4P7_PHAAN|nr:hypothetical protein LR48_Vigan118s002500 [Vigna angularis]
MSYYSPYDNFSFPYNAQPQGFDPFYESFLENFMQQPPPYFHPICEQQPWNQYEEPKQEDFQSLQPWQDQFCDQAQQDLPSTDFQEMTNQVAQLVSTIKKLTRRAEEEKGVETNGAPLMVAAAPEFQVIKCPTTSVIVYTNPSFTNSHSVLNSVNDNSNSLMSGDCMNASVDSESVCELYVGDESTEPHSEID